MDVGSAAAARLMVPIQRLFRLKRAMKRRIECEDGDENDLLELRRAIRACRSSKLVDSVYELVDKWIDHPSTLPKSKLGEALTYLVNQEKRLRCFLEVDDPRLPIHNNDCERALRHLAVGRKNWLFFGSPRGGRVAADLYSLMLSSRAAQVNPEAYLADVLTKVATTPMSEIASLTPWAWAQAHPEARIDPA